jgi:hypothetical protein
MEKKDMSDSFFGGFIFALFAGVLVGGVWGAMHCQSFGFFTACF